MMRKALIGAAAALLGLNLATAEAAEGVAIPSQDWSFAGPFGKFDAAARQRGFQVFKEVCAGCHSLNLIAFRNFLDLGYTEDEVKALAAEFSVVDGPNDDGEMFERDGKPSDFWPAPFPNDKAAAAANGGAVPPDLSLITKARKKGPDYLYALLTGYVDPPADFELLEGLNYNNAFPGHQIAMANPLFDDAVEYADGTPATVDQMSRDLVNFLVWTAEPEMEDRKAMGIKVMIFLVIFSVLLYAVKRKIWADLH
jgi:ubiquinol-cytochrome c reductase cytochrome c1 subunit